MKTVIAFTGVIGVALSLNRCKWLQWNEDDWPANDGQQDFRPVVGDAYYDDEDLGEGGRFEGEDWFDVFIQDTDYWQPLGFRKARIQPFNEEFPCFNVSGAGGHKVELMIYTIQAQSPIAVTDISVDGIYKQESGVVQQSSVEKSYNCFTANTNLTSMLHVAAYCDENCPEAEIDILWRFRRSKLTWQSPRNATAGNVEMWCNMIASMIEWPSDLSRGNPDDVDESANDNYENAAFTATGAVALLASVFAAAMN